MPKPLVEAAGQELFALPEPGEEPQETEALLAALARAVEGRDRGLSGHCLRLDTLTLLLGKALGVPAPDLAILHQGAFLHDIGKITVPDSILFKPGRLNHHEWAIMRRHTVNGEAICRRFPTLSATLPLIRSHHERWDGSGYPDKLTGEEIPLLARIVQMADIFDALTSERPYKHAYSLSRALKIIEEETHRGWRQPELLEALRGVWRDYFGAQLGTVFVRELPPELMRESLANMRAALLRQE